MKKTVIVQVKVLASYESYRENEVMESIRKMFNNPYNMTRIAGNCSDGSYNWITAEEDVKIIDII